jgi:hypothetical protein
MGANHVSKLPNPLPLDGSILQCMIKCGIMRGIFNGG